MRAPAAAIAESRKTLRASPRRRAAPPAPARMVRDISSASRDRRLRFAELLLSISKKMSGMDSLDDVLTGLVEVT
ncbi:MAG: hypothetical protein ABIS45_01845, partial [Burkholderiales bacterium]